MPKSRFFRVAVEGATTDGRTIERSWLTDIAETYNPQTYAARVNLEHIRGVTGDPPFQTLADILSVRTEEVDIEIGGKTEKRLALFAEIEALEPLVQLNRRKQKMYTSIEVNPNFANSGKAYLVGLAVTDSPASLGTEMLQFCAQLGENSPLAHRKQHPGNLFTAAIETEIVLDDNAAQDGATAGLMASIKGLLEKLSHAPREQAANPAPAENAPAALPDAAANLAVGASLAEMATAIQAFTIGADAKIAQMARDIAGLKSARDAQPVEDYRERQPATGGDGGLYTDC